jgi:acetolactate synthase I/II/III large subunit
LTTKRLFGHSGAVSGEPRVYHVLADELVALPTRAAFGLMGEDTAALTTELVGRGIDYYATRHEAGAVGMADGYSWATSDLGIAMVTRGPGLTNALTALHTAVRARRRVLLLTGDASTDRTSWPEDNKYVDAEAVAASVGLAFFPVRDATETVSVLRDAVASAMVGRPALLSVAHDVLNGPAGPAGTERVRAEEAVEEPPAEADAVEIEAIAHMLAAALRPLVLVGRGAARPELRPLIEELAERTGALIGTTLLAKDFFRGHRLALGVVGGFASDPAEPLLREVDCALVLGASLTQFTTGYRTLFKNATVIHVDRDPKRIGATFRADAGVVADAGRVVGQLIEALPASNGAGKPFHREETLATLRGPLFLGEDGSVDGALDPRTVAVTLDELLPENRTLVIDAGRFMTSPSRFIRVPGPDCFRLTADAGSIGVGLGPALGAAVARPGSQTVLFIGDGGLSLSIADLETAARHRIPLIAVAMNDHGYGAERLCLAADGLPLDGADIDDMDFAAVARAVGIEAATARTVDELRSHAAALAGRTTPFLLDCKIRDDYTTPRLRW